MQRIILLIAEHQNNTIIKSIQTQKRKYILKSDKREFKGDSQHTAKVLTQCIYLLCHSARLRLVVDVQHSVPDMRAQKINNVNIL